MYVCLCIYVRTCDGFTLQGNAVNDGRLDVSIPNVKPSLHAASCSLQMDRINFKQHAKEGFANYSYPHMDTSMDIHMYIYKDNALNKKRKDTYIYIDI